MHAYREIEKGKRCFWMTDSFYFLVPCYYFVALSNEGTLTPTRAEQEPASVCVCALYRLI